jgi:hypothetical protein
MTHDLDAVDQCKIFALSINAASGCSSIKRAIVLIANTSKWAAYPSAEDIVVAVYTSITNVYVLAFSEVTGMQRTSAAIYFSSI